MPDRDHVPGPVPVSISRRRFLRTGGAAVLAGAVTGLVGCDDEQHEHQPLAATDEHVDMPAGFVYDPVPQTPDAPLATNVLHFFTGDEARTVDALASRIVPGTPDDPGAHEAHVVDYIDIKLGTTPGGFATGIYTKPPFATSYEGTPPAPPTPADHTTIYVAKDQLERYGYQSISNYREIFRTGLAALDGLAKNTFGATFVALTADQQDQLIGQLADGSASGFAEPSAKMFFGTVRDHVIEGFLSDPVYGGNHDMVGWRLVGYPGPQRAYTPADVRGETPLREPQSITQMEMYHAPIASGPNAVLPVSGSDHRDGH